MLAFGVANRGWIFSPKHLRTIVNETKVVVIQYAENLR